MFIKQQALGGFRQVNDDELLVRGSTVLQALTDNAFFPTPNPSLADLESKLQEFQEKLSVARRRGSPQDTAAKNDCRVELENVLKQLAFYVSMEADGSLQKLLSSGFDVSRYPRAGNVPNTITGVFLRDGKQSGQMRLDFNRDPQALLYEYCIANERDESGELIWGDAISTSSSRQHIIAPVTPFKRHYVRVRAINGYGKSEWSEPVSFIPR